MGLGNLTGLPHPGFPASHHHVPTMQAPAPFQCPPAGTSEKNSQRPQLCPQTRMFIVCSC